jgi:hypothetical protein
LTAAETGRKGLKHAQRQPEPDMADEGHARAIGRRFEMPLPAVAHHAAPGLQRDAAARLTRDDFKHHWETHAERSRCLPKPGANARGFGRQQFYRDDRTRLFRVPRWISKEREHVIHCPMDFDDVPQVRHQVTLPEQGTAKRGSTRHRVHPLPREAVA